jgi:hypothetical protein
MNLTVMQFQEFLSVDETTEFGKSFKAQHPAGGDI